MFIADLLRERRVTVSCELFPPKQREDMAEAESIVRETARLNPDFISVTYGASGATSRNTAHMAEYIQAQNALALAHLTCVSATREELGGLLADLHARGVRNIFEHILGAQNNRLAAMENVSREDLMELKPEDVYAARGIEPEDPETKPDDDPDDSVDVDVDADVQVREDAPGEGE